MAGEKVPWPFEKCKEALRRAAQSTTPASPAVILSMGTMGPAHLGHVQMLYQAQERLVRAGYEVLGGWLSPSGRTQAGMAGSLAPEPLSADFRLHTASLACEGDDLVDVASWEALLGRAASPTEVVAALRAALRAEFTDASWVAKVRIFVVCAGEDVKQYQRVATGEKQGLVVVPRPDAEDQQLEKPTQLMYVAETPLDHLTLLSDSKLRGALTAGDHAFVINSTTESGAQFLLEPSKEAVAKFSADFALLKQAPEGVWPSKKLMHRLVTSPDGKYPAVLVASGAMSPLHQGHVLMMWEAKARLERAGYAVVAAWLSPAGAAAAEREAQEKGSPQLSVAFRQKVAELSVCDDDFVDVRSRELDEQGGLTSARDLCRELQQYLSDRFSASFEGRAVRVFYVCGTDAAEKNGLYSGVLPQNELGVVIVPRNDEEPRLEVPGQLVYVADAIPGDASAFSSSRVRGAIKENNVASASQEMAPAASRYVLAPTPAERAEMSADFVALGARGLEPGDLDQAVTKLKEHLRAWAGPQGSIHSDDLTRLLHFIDPSWTEKETSALMGGAQVSPDGFLTPDQFIDWLFNR